MIKFSEDYFRATPKCKSPEIRSSVIKKLASLYDCAEDQDLIKSLIAEDLWQLEKHDLLHKHLVVVRGWLYSLPTEFDADDKALVPWGEYSLFQFLERSSPTVGFAVKSKQVQLSG